jgi:hypothetical protein
MISWGTKKAAMRKERRAEWKENRGGGEKPGYNDLRQLEARWPSIIKTLRSRNTV